MEIKVFNGKEVPQEYKEQINILLFELNKLGESKIKQTTFDTDRFVIGLIDDKVVGFVKLSGSDNNLCTIAYIARNPHDGKGVAKTLIKYIQENLPISKLLAGVESNVPDKIERLLTSCDFVKGRQFFEWKKV